MKKILLISLSSCLLFLGCSKTPEKPKMTISEYTNQALTTKGVVDKLLNEPDYKKMHEIALAVESSRAVNCISVSEECNILGMVLNKIVESTRNGPPGEAENVAIYKLSGQLDHELQIGHEKLADQWSEYIKMSKEKE